MGVRRTRVFALLVYCAVMFLSVAAAEAKEYRSVPEDGRIVLKDYKLRDWGPELVHYEVDTSRFPPGQLVLLDEDNQAIPFQIEDGVLSFVASLNKGGERLYQLNKSAKDRSDANSTLQVRKTKKHIQAGNEYFTLRMPAVASEKFDKPVKGTQIPGPLTGFKTAGSGWMGGTHFALKTWKVKSYDFKVLQNGPVRFEYEARYEFAPRGRYVWRVRVSPGMPVAMVSEELDAGELTQHTKNFLMLDLQKGWDPKRIAYAQQSGETGMKTSPYDLASHVKKKRKAHFKPSSFGGTGKPPAPTVPQDGMFRLARIAAGGKWGGLLGGVQLCGAKSENEDQQEPRVGLVPMHVGSWRRAMVLDVWYGDEKGVSVELPLDARWMWWQYDTTDERSPFSTHEHDENLKRSYARREWGLYFGDKLHKAQWRYGFVGLDRYKEYVLDWPAPENSQETYPRAFFTPDVVKEIKANLSENPDKTDLEKFYVISEDPEHARNHAERFLRQATGGHHQHIKQWHVYGLSHYRQAQTLTWGALADDALACPELPDELRTRIRRYLAIWAYLLSEPDFNPRGAGVHLGNNNMTINRTTGLAYFAPLIPKHPMYDYWMERLAQFTHSKLATQMAPDGTWVACPNYQLYGPMRFLNAATIALKNTGQIDLTGRGYFRRDVQYLANLTQKDIRFNDLRIIPGMGNSADRVTTIFGLLMRAVGSDADGFAGWMRRLHRLCVGPNGVANMPGNGKAAPFFFRNDVDEEPVDLKTEFFPTYGVMFRDHMGTDGETSMLFRAGMNWSHWDTDALNVILYGKGGVPLSPGTGYGYGPRCISANNAIYHNQVKIVRHDLKEIFGRVDDTVRRYGFLDHADYAMADRYYPPELFDDEAERHWRRHVLFVKGETPDDPSYFVMRDTFPGNPETDRSWWTWLNLGEADMIEVDGQALDPEATPHDTVPENLDELPTVSGNSIEMKTDYGAGTRFWFSGDAPLKCRARLTFTVDIRIPFKDSLPKMDFSKYLPNKKETKTIFEAMAPRGEDYFYVTYPHADGEKVPAFKRLGDGCIKVTRPGLTDYNFISDEPLNFQRDDVVFTGRSGSVRVFDDRVVLSMNDGSGRIGYDGHIIEGHGPFERTVKMSDLEDGVHQLEDTRKKWYITRHIGGGIKIWGEGPFEAELDDETIRINTRGRERVLHLSKPDFIRRPAYRVDGQEWMACWNDWPASGFGRWARSELIGLTVPAGRHTLEVTDLKFPPVWNRQFEPVLEGVGK